MKRVKPSIKKKAKRKSPKSNSTAGHKARFEQLLDDAVLGVKKK